jgi:hypothetical protein
VSAASLKDSQLEMARFLRDPDHQPAPRGVEPRRLAIYQRLVYNNIESFISGGFPVLHSLYQGREADWEKLVRQFIDVHSCNTPYFLEISQEFIDFLMNQYQRTELDPPFMVELAHYEWVELALDVSEAIVPPAQAVDDVLAAVPGLSPLAWLLSYQFPVHRIGPGYQPSEAAEPSYLVVYRDREDRVQFMELTPATARLLELTRDNSGATAGEILHTLAAELGMPAQDVLAFGAGQFETFVEQALVTVACS